MKPPLLHIDAALIGNILQTGRTRSEPDDELSAVHLIIAPSMQGQIDPVCPFRGQLESCEGSPCYEGRPKTVRLSLCVT